MASREAPTLRNVAQAAGVSTATVSRCLNTPGLVRPSTRLRIEQTVAMLGYTPNFGARMLASRRSNAVGVIIPTMANAIFARALQAFQEEMAPAGVTMLVASSGYDPACEARQIRILAGRGADGFLLVGTARPEETYRFLGQRGIPYVIAWSHHDGGNAVHVGFDNRAAARELAGMVLARGHRHIAMIAGITAGNDRAGDRVAGVRQALGDAGFEPSLLPVVEASYTTGAGGRAFRRLLEDGHRPSAIMCGNDVLAVGVILEARKMGLSVPGDVSVAGFDDIDLATVISPELTTVHVPHRRMGQLAARTLLALRDGHRPESVRLETRIVMRHSLAPPGRNGYSPAGKQPGRDRAGHQADGTAGSPGCQRPGQDFCRLTGASPPDRYPDR